MRNIKSGSVKMMAVMLVFIVILSFLPADTAKAAVITEQCRGNADTASGL